MAFVALLHIYAYPLRPYKIWHRPKALENIVVGEVNTYTGIGMALVALIEMVNVLDLFAGIYRAFKYLVFDIRFRHHEIGYVNQHKGERSFHGRGKGRIIAPDFRGNGLVANEKNTQAMVVEKPDVAMLKAGSSI